VPEDRRIQFRVGIHVGDVVEESDGDLMGDGVNIAARLEGIAKPGAICLSEDAYRQVKGRLDFAVTDLGATQLKNIAEPIHLEVGQPAEAKPVPPAPEKSGPPRLSLVVLPFANIGGDPEQDYFADGVTESLTTDLSRISGAFVIGRSTAFTYKGKAVDLKQTGRDLNVRYVLEGSVQRGGGRMRVNVQLIDAETGSHLWGERFDKPVADLFDVQDEIVARLANQLQAELIAAEARRAEQAPNPDSMDFCFQGRATLNRGNSPEILAKAREFFERALELDRGNIDALVGLGTVDASIGSSFMGDDPGSFLEAAEANFARALIAAPNNALAHRGMGMVLGRTKRTSRAIEEFERALSIDPNLAKARASLGVALAFAGRAEETEAQVLEALRLSPRRGELCLVPPCRRSEGVSCGIRSSGRVAEKIDRREPKQCGALLLFGRMPRAFRAARRGARGDQNRSRDRSEIQRRALSRRCPKRQHETPRAARARDRRPAQSRDAGGR
jgi:TolB-like protein